MRWDTGERKKENEENDRGRIVRGGVKQIEGKGIKRKKVIEREREERHRQREGRRERYRYRDI